MTGDGLNDAPALHRAAGRRAVLAAAERVVAGWPAFGGQLCELLACILVQLLLHRVAGAEPLAQVLQCAARQYVHQRQRRAGLMRQARGTVGGMPCGRREVSGGEDRAPVYRHRVGSCP